MEIQWNFPYPSRRMPVLARNVVATSQPLAAQAGLQMLVRGGNADTCTRAESYRIAVAKLKDEMRRTYEKDGDRIVMPTFEVKNLTIE